MLADSKLAYQRHGLSDSEAVAKLVLAVEQGQGRDRESSSRGSFFDLKAARDRIVLHNLRGVAGGFVIGLAFFIPANWFRLPADARLPVIAFNLLLGCAAAAMWWAVSRDRIPARLANASAVAIFFLGMANILFAFRLIADPIQTNFLVIMVIAAGCIVLSLGWLLATLAVTLVGWVAVAWWTVAGNPQLPHFAATLFCAGILSVVLHQVRWRNYNQLVAALGASRRELSDRREIEDSLRRSELNYRRLFEQSRDAVTISTPAGRLVDVNQAGVELFEYQQQEDMIGLDLATDLYVNSEERQRLLERLQEKGFVKEWETEMRTRKNRRVWVEGTTSSVLDGDSQVFAFLTILRDVTDKRAIQRQLDQSRLRLEERTLSLRRAVLDLEQEIRERQLVEEQRRRLEERFQQTQKLESLGVLAGGIAHDFNNLLVGILGNCGLALMDMKGEASGRTYVEEIEKAGQRATDLANQMLAYSGKGRFQVEPIDLERLVREMAELLETSISKKAELDFSFGPAVPPIDGDVTQIRQVVMNLIINASEALGDDPGRIEVRLGVLEADAKFLEETYVHDSLEPGRYVGLEVADDGCGMDELTRNKLFDPFFTTKFTGRGLGMAAVLGILRGHGGAIRVESEVGTGTRFRLLFPASRQTRFLSSAILQAPIESPWRGEGKVLVVDDEDSVRLVLRRSLERFGFQVDTAINGNDAVKKFRENLGSYVAVLLDLTMPQMDGEQTYRALLEIQPSAKVIIVSGYDEEEVADRFSGRPPAAVLKKPFRPADLRHQMQAVLDP